MRHSGLVLALAVLVTSPNPARPEPDHAPDRLLIKLGAGITADALPAFGRPRGDLGIASVDALLAVLDVREVERLLPPAPSVGRHLAETLGLDRWCAVRFAEGVDLDAARASLGTSNDVEIVEFDGRGEGASVTPNDPDFLYQWHLNNFAHPNVTIHATEGWVYGTGSASVVVAILDTGGDWDHQDLASRIWSNPGEIPGNGVDDDLNGYVDDVRGWDFVNNDNDPVDDHGHGTHVAGIAGAATDNGLGVAGVDWNCRLLLAKNLDATNSGLYSWWTASIYYAANQGAKVLNMSEGGLSFSSAMRDAVNYAHGIGALVCAAMMNANTSAPYYPANYTNTIAVGATNDLDRRAVPFCWGGGSNYGSHIDLVAPGDRIRSTLWDNTYGILCGTSQATPQVSATAALLWALRPDLTNAMVRDYLLANADDQVGDPMEDTWGHDPYYGYGRLNVNRALSAAYVVSVEPGPAADVLDVRIVPNPIAGAATLRYRIPRPGRIELEVYDIGGRHLVDRSGAVAATVDGTIEFDASQLAAGVYVVRVDLRDADGSRVGSAARRVVVVR